MERMLDHRRAWCFPSETGGLRLVSANPRWSRASVLGLLLAVAALAGCGRSSAQPSTEEATAVGTLFLERIRHGSAAEAWQSTTAEFKSALGQDRFVRYVADRPVLGQPLTFRDAQTVVINEQPRVECAFRHAETGAVVKLLIGREHDTWRVDRLTIE